MAFTLADGSRGGPDWIAPLRLSAEDARAARVLAGRVAMKIAPDQQIGFAFKERADGLVALLQGQDRPAFLIAGDAGSDAGFTQGGDLAVAYRRLELMLLERSFNGTEKVITRKDGSEERVREYPNTLAVQLLKMHKDTAESSEREPGEGEMEELRAKLQGKVERLRARLLAEEAEPE